MNVPYNKAFRRVIDSWLLSIIFSVDVHCRREFMIVSLLVKEYKMPNRV